MRPKLIHYAISGSSVVVAKSIGFFSTLVVTFLLNNFLGKEEYATYEFVMSLVYIAANVSLFGLDRVVLYRISRLKIEVNDLAGSEVVGFVLRLVAAISISSAFVFCLLAILFESQLQFQNFLFWLLILSVIIPVFAVNQVCIAWFQARQRLAEAMMIPATADVCRMIFLALILVVSSAPEWAAIALVFAALVPLVVWAARIPAGALRGIERITKWEIKYGAKMMLTVAAHRGIERIDILMMGILSTVILTANYAVAARLAIFVTLGNILLGPAFAPRMGRLLADNRRDEFIREYAQNRLGALTVALSCAVFFIVAGPFLLAIFGDYRNSQPVLLILSAAHVIMVGFGPNGRYLGMAGRAGWLLVATLLLLVATVGFNLILIPMFGAEGAALGTLLSFLVINVVLSLFIWRLDHLPTMSWSVLIIVITASAVLVMLAVDAIDKSIAGTSIFALLIFLLFSERNLWLPVARNVYATIRSGVTE